MSLPDPLPIRFGNATLFSIAKVYSPVPNQSVFRKEYADGKEEIWTFTQAQTKTRKRHLVRMDSNLPADVNGVIRSVTAHLTIDEPSNYSFDDATMTSIVTSLFETSINQMPRILNGEL
jgi:hypothetical protein